MSINLVILAAGKGTRMKSDSAKVLHKVAGAPLLIHAMKAGTSLEPQNIVIVAGHEADAVSAAALAYDESAQIVLQTEQKGTGHAVLCTKDALQGATGDLLVLYGDTPFISPETLDTMRSARARFDVVVLGFEAADPARYGRLVMDGNTLERIIYGNVCDWITLTRPISEYLLVLNFADIFICISLLTLPFTVKGLNSIQR